MVYWLGDHTHLKQGPEHPGIWQTDAGHSSSHCWREREVTSCGGN